MQKHYKRAFKAFGAGEVEDGVKHAAAVEEACDELEVRVQAAKSFGTKLPLHEKKRGERELVGLRSLEQLDKWFKTGNSAYTELIGARGYGETVKIALDRIRKHKWRERLSFRPPAQLAEAREMLSKARASIDLLDRNHPDLGRGW
jgi:hypothetical protein